MNSGKVTLKLTKHAQNKILQRNISLENIREVVEAPEWMETDKFDRSLTHFIGKVKERFFRVIGRWEGEEILLVISAFYDRRIKRREKDDKD